MRAGLPQNTEEGLGRNIYFFKIKIKILKNIYKNSFLKLFNKLSCLIFDQLTVKTVGATVKNNQKLNKIITVNQDKLYQYKLDDDFDKVKYQFELLSFNLLRSLI